MTYKDRVNLETQIATLNRHLEMLRERKTQQELWGYEVELDLKGAKRAKNEKRIAEFENSLKEVEQALADTDADIEVRLAELKAITSNRDGQRAAAKVAKRPAPKRSNGRTTPRQSAAAKE